MKELLLGLLLFLSFNAFSQLAPEYEKYKTRFGDATKVILNREVILNLELKNDQLEIYQDNLEENLFMTEGANYAARENLHFSYFIELMNVEAHSTLYEGNKAIEYEVEDFVEKDNLDNSFYDDTKSMVFLYPNLKKGAKTFLKYSEKIKNPRFLGAFYFADTFPLASGKFSVVADENISLQFREFNTEGLDIKFNKEEKWGKVIYSWEIKEIDKYRLEESSPNFRSLLPHIIPIITSYQTKEKKIDLLGSVNHLYGWYYSLVKDINKDEPAPELVRTVQELTRDKNTELEKVKAIYYWTQENIKYIAYEYALGGFIPREANTVYERKYGDCKDNSSILKEMLEIAGIEGNLTWIGTRSIPYKYEEVPTPMVDNHMILTYRSKDDKVYYLDATGRYNSLGYPSSFIQGKEALIENGEGNYILEKVPVIPTEMNKIKDESFLRIEANELVGKATAEIYGYGKSDYAFILEDLDTKSKIHEFYNLKFQKGNNKFLIDSLVEIDRTHYDRPLKVEYTFGIKDYIKNFGEELYINLNLNREVTLFKVKDDRETPIEYDFTKNYDFTNTLEIPDTYSIEYLPKDFEVSNDFFSSRITYVVEKNKIVYRMEAVLDFLTLNTTQQKELNKQLEELEKAFREVVILKKINS